MDQNGLHRVSSYGQAQAAESSSDRSSRLRQLFPRRAAQGSVAEVPADFVRLPTRLHSAAMVPNTAITNQKMTAYLLEANDKRKSFCDYHMNLANACTIASVKQKPFGKAAVTFDTVSQHHPGLSPVSMPQRLQKASDDSS